MSARPDRTFRSERHRKGNFLVFTAALMIVLAGVLAFAIDVGYLYVARTQLQNAADSAAMAAAWEMLDETRLQGDEPMLAVRSAARIKAAEYAGRNIVCATSPDVDLNAANDPSGDVVLGRYSSLSGMSTAGSLESHNAVRVRVGRTWSRNGEVPLFFARVLGFETSAVSADAVAMFRDGIVGFQPTPEHPITSLLPFALDIEDWYALLNGSGPDDWTFDTFDQEIVAGDDGVTECKLYPMTKNGNSPNITSGNFGTVDIGSEANSTEVLERQIRQGISAEDLAYHGGQLKLDDVTGELSLNGEAGISIGMSDALEDILGKPRTIPLYREVTGGGGNTTYYTIVAFAGIRLLDYDLSGQNKYLTIQPAIVVDDTAMSGGPEEASYSVYQPVILVK